MIIFWYLITSLMAQTPAPLKDVPCLDQVVKAIDAAGTPKEWLRFPGGVASRIPEFGSIEVYPGKQLTRFVMVSPKNTTGFIVEQPKCEARVLFTKPNQASLRDIDIAELMQKNKNGGLIYVWSPHMELSVQEVADLKKYNVQYPITVAVDPEADSKLLAKVMKDKKLPQEYQLSANSSVLFEADNNIHYPSTIFYKYGKVVMRIPGYHGSGLNEIAQKVLR